MIDIQYESKKPTPSELLEIFPEAIPIIKRNLREYKQQLAETEPFLREVLANFIRSAYRGKDDPADPWHEFINAWGVEFHSSVAKILFYDHFINPLEGHIKRLSHLLKIHEWQRKPTSDSSITDLDIAHAKEFRITEFVTPNRSGFISCLWHQEKSASCKIHKDNRYHCYGCGADGDVIDLVSKLFGLDFISAVKKILNK